MTILLSELANIADRIMEVAIPDIPTAATPNLATVSSSPQVFNMISLHAEITHLKDELKSLRRSSRERPPHRHSPSPAANVPSVRCWHHQKFGSATQKFGPPCSYSGSASAGH